MNKIFFVFIGKTIFYIINKYLKYSSIFFSNRIDFEGRRDFYEGVNNFFATGTI